MEKYKIKENEAFQFADFIMPMLEYYPEKRISAQELLKHPWLSMPANFDYYMSEKDHQKLKMIKNNTRRERTADETILDVIESDADINNADNEDNDDEINFLEDKTECSDNDIFQGNSNDIFHIPNYNNSFAAYGQFINLSCCDRPNPQFEHLGGK